MKHSSWICLCAVVLVACGDEAKPDPSPGVGDGGAPVSQGPGNPNGTTKPPAPPAPPAGGW